uniref:Uncharacterized protein n=1 Tax=Rhabditophanes sp. KR3021 TaxID=114890 RepID=A0AC35U489_9BILA
MESSMSNLTSDILRMGDYSLTRARSAIALRSRSCEPRSTLLLTRTSSVPDLTAHIRNSYRYRPIVPYRYHRDYSLGDSYWYDRYHYFSPLYRTTNFPRRYSYSDSISNPYYWNPYDSTYWTRYKGYHYDYRYPYTSRKYYPSYYSSIYDSDYPHYSTTSDALAKSYANGLDMYRGGGITHDALTRYWLTPSYWDRRFRYWADLVPASSGYKYYVPSYHRRALDSYGNYLY